MDQDSVERRRGRRVNLQAAVLLRRMGSNPPEPFKEEQAKNVSLAGVYFESEQRYQPDEMMMASISIPPASQTRDFPFTRVAGRTRVVRVDEVSGKGAGAQQRFGVALEFGSDVTALTAIPGRG